MKNLNPYLNFNGNTEEVFNFYKQVFGGEFTSIMRYKDIPADVPMDGCGDDDGKITEEDANKIMHISLPIGSNVLMASDTPHNMNQVTMGNNITISVTVESKEEADRVYAELSAGGKSIMPMNNTFWGSYFGMLIDKFAIQWMVNFETENK